MDIKSLYTSNDKTIMKLAEDSKNRSNDRVQEIIEYAKEARIRKIGIAHCTLLNNEAKVLADILLSEGFLIERVHCKYGKVPFSELVLGYNGISCNPAGQAFYLAEQNTELNIMMGLCLGHDMIFNAKSKAPVTPLIVKDRKLKHCTIRRLQ